MAPPARLHMEVLLLPRQDMPASLTPIRCISAFFLPDLGKDTDNKTAVSDAPASSHRRLLPHSTLPVPDVCFEEDGELVVLDYKTDKIWSEQKLLEKYQSQLEYYARALEQITGKKVREKIIYSFTMQKELAWK